MTRIGKREILQRRDRSHVILLSGFSTEHYTRCQRLLDDYIANHKTIELLVTP